MRVRHRAAAASLMLAAAFAGCGGDSTDEQASENRVASKPAAQVVADAAAALRRARSVHMEGTVSIEKKRTPVEIDLERPGRIRFAFKQEDASVGLIVVGDSVYIRANAAFWRKQGGGRAASDLAGQWLEVPASDRELRDLTKDLNFETLSRCLVKSHGTIAVGDKATVNGEPAVTVVDEGDHPGTAPGKLFVATTGEPFPLRATTTGKQRPGGKRDPQCNDPSSPSQAGDQVTFSRYNEPLNIEPPSDAQDLTPGDPAGSPQTSRS